MRFKIHYTLSGTDDYFIVEGDNIEEVKQQSNEQETIRGLTVEKNDLWSEEIT